MWSFLSAWFVLHCGKEVFHAGVRNGFSLGDSSHLYDLHGRPRRLKAQLKESGVETEGI